MAKKRAKPATDDTSDAWWLAEVIKAGDIKNFEPFLASSLDLNAVRLGERELTPLELAFESRADDIAIALLKAGAKTNPGPLNLVWAVCTEDPHIVRIMIEAGADLHANAIMGSPLDVAAHRGLTEIVGLLVEAGADIDARRWNDYPLKDAVTQNHTDTAKLLLQAGAKIGAEDHLLTVAVDKQNRALAAALIAAAADVNDRSDVTVWNEIAQDLKVTYPFVTPLMLAAATGQADLVDDLLAAHADVHVTDANGATAPDWAQRNGHRQIADRLTMAVAKVPRKVSPETDLLLAAQAGDAKKAKKLLAASADPNTRDDRSHTKAFTPLMLAAAAGATDVIATLLDAGADLELCDDTETDNSSAFNFINSQGGAQMAREAGFQLHRTALAIAAENGRAEAVRLLIERGAEVDVLDRVKCTPLLLAAEADSIDTVKELLRGGANVNARNRAKESALLMAARAGNVDIINELAAAGAKLELKDADGNMPLILAAGAARPDAVAALLAAGADVNAATKRGVTALNAPLGTRHLIRDVEDGEIVTKFRIDPARILETVRLLLESGADPTVATELDGTPLAGAKMIVELTGKLHELIDMLESASGTAGKPSKKKAVPKTVNKLRDALAEQKTTKKKAKSKKPTRPELLLPDFSKAAKTKQYDAAVVELEKICGTKRQPLGETPGAYTLHLHSSKLKTWDLDQVHADFLKKGCYVFKSGPKDRIVILPTTSRNDAIATMQTNGANFDLMPADIVAWLDELEKEQPFAITGISFDSVSGRFKNKVKKPAELAQRMYKFCPDIVDQGCLEVEELAAELRRTNELYFWWD